MAWLTPKTLTCTACGFSGDVQYLNERTPAGEKRKRLFRFGPFRRAAEALHCPSCAAAMMELAP